MDRETIRKMRSLRDTPAQLDKPSREVYLGKVAVVGSGNASGFGETFARAVLMSHPENRVVLTARKRKIGDVKRRVEEGVYDGSRTEIVEFDVTEPRDLGLIVNGVVVCPAYMNPKHLRKEVRFEDIPQEDVDESVRVTVEGFENSVRAFRLDNKSCTGYVWGISFAAKDFPGYNIGPVKKMLEERIVIGERLVDNVNQNVLSLGIFDSVAGLGIESFKTAERIYAALGIKKPSISEMVYSAVGFVADRNLDRTIQYADGGLGEFLKSPEGRLAYEKFISTLE